MNKPTNNSASKARSGFSRHLGMVALSVVLLGLLAVLVILFGARLGLWEPIVGFGYYRTYFNFIAYISAGIAGVALLLSLINKSGRNIALSGLAFVISAMLSYPIIIAIVDPPVRAPPIHNISTDMQNPPEFLALDDTRPGASNSLKYGGAEIAAAQAEAYPDIVPILTDLSGPKAYSRALAIANNMDWTFVERRDDTLQFEATARTPVFYFADDIVVVITPIADGSRIDMRSVSRVGRSDQGINAERIRAFTRAFNEQS